MIFLLDQTSAQASGIHSQSQKPAAKMFNMSPAAKPVVTAEKPRPAVKRLGGIAINNIKMMCV